jgi:ribosomal 50S subunit-recycling heat shock protein
MEATTDPACPRSKSSTASPGRPARAAPAGRARSAWRAAAARGCGLTSPSARGPMPQSAEAMPMAQAQGRQAEGPGATQLRIAPAARSQDRPRQPVCGTGRAEEPDLKAWRRRRNRAPTPCASTNGLWHARFFKTRALAADIVSRGRLRRNGARITKPGTAVMPGDTLTFPQGTQIRVVRIVATGTRRGPAAEAQALYHDLAPPAEDTRPRSP